MALSDYRAQKVSYVENIVENRVFMRLAAPIGYDDREPYTIIGALFAEEMYYHKSLGREVTVKINSGGGSIIDMFSIRDAIITCNAATHNMGLAASAAGILLTCGARGQRTADDISTFMAHPPKGGDPEYRDNVREQFARELGKRTKFTPEKITEFFKDGGKNHWFQAKDQQEFGVVDHIIKTDAQMPRLEFDSESRENVLKVYNSIIDKQTENKTMSIWNSLFSGKDESENIVNAVQMKTDNERLKAEKATADAKITELTNKVIDLEKRQSEGDNKVKAFELIDGAIKAGKLSFKDEADKTKMIEIATTNYESVKIMIANMASVSKKTASAAAIIKNESAGAAGDAKNTYEYLAVNNPEELDRIALEDEELFNKLSDEYIARQREANVSK